MTLPYCPRCQAYKTSAYRLAHEVRELEDVIKADDKAAELQKSRQALKRAEGERDRLRVEKASEWKLPTLEEFEETLGYDKGEHIPSRGQWLEAQAVPDMIDDLIDEWNDGRLPEDFVRLAKKLMGRA